VVVARNLDLVLLAVALAVFAVAGLPLGGWAVALGIWAMWRGVGAWAERKAAAASTPRDIVGITTGSMIGRGWILGLALLGAGLAFGDDVGLSAAILCVILFTVSFTTKLIFRPLDGPGASTT
jgi:hypothetical protein